MFLSEGDLYVSNTRVILRNTTYATANITSVRGHMTPANLGGAIALFGFGALTAFVGLIALFNSALAGIITLFFAAVFVYIGILAYRSAKPMYHVYLASASGERQSYSSQDVALVNRITHAITNAIVSRADGHHSGCEPRAPRQAWRRRIHAGASLSPGC